MSSLDSYSHYVTVSYIIIYGSIFLFVAVYSAYDAYITHQHNEETTASRDQPHEKRNESLPLNDEKEAGQQSKTNIIDCGDATETKDDDIDNDDDSTTKKKKKKCCGIGCLKFLKAFYRSIATKKSIYLSLIPHLFDQGTDFGVIWQYYALWKSDTSQNPNNEHINYAAFFYCSIAVIIIHKIITCSVIFTLTQSICNVMLQIFDLMMVKAIYANYKLRTNEPGNAQKLLQILEGTFESGPQIFISLVFLIKSDTFDTIVFISLLFSFWTLTSRVIAEDKQSVKKEWKEHQFTYKKCPIINKKYLIRVLFRYTEIMSHITLFALLWVSLGGFAVGIILGLELLVVLIVSIRSKEVMIVANLLYFFIFDIDGELNDLIYGVFIFYKFIVSPVIYMILITIFVYTSFEAPKVEEYHIRHYLVIEAPIGLLAFVYCWITCVLLPCFIACSQSNPNLEYMQSYDDDITRDFKGLSHQGKLKDVLNLVAFGMPKKKLLFQDDDGSILHSLFKYCVDFTMFTVFCEILFELDPNIWKIKNKKGKLCTFDAYAYSEPIWRMIRHLVDKYDANENDLVCNLNPGAFDRILRKENIDNIPGLIYMKGPNGTIMHHLFEYRFTHFDKVYKEVCERIHDKQLWKEPDQYGLLCGDVAFRGKDAVEYITYLVDEYKIDPKHLFSDISPFSLFVKYGLHAKEIIDLCDMEYDTDETESELNVLSRNIKQYFDESLDFLKEKQVDKFRDGGKKFESARVGLRNTVLHKLGRKDYSMAVAAFNVLKQLIEADGSWLRYRGDILGGERQSSVIDAAKSDLEKNKIFLEWLKMKGYML